MDGEPQGGLEDLVSPHPSPQGQQQSRHVARERPGELRPAPVDEEVHDGEVVFPAAGGEKSLGPGSHHQDLVSLPAQQDGESAPVGRVRFDHEHRPGWAHLRAPPPRAKDVPDEDVERMGLQEEAHVRFCVIRTGVSEIASGRPRATPSLARGAALCRALTEKDFPASGRRGGRTGPLVSVLRSRSEKVPMPRSRETARSEREATSSPASQALGPNLPSRLVGDSFRHRSGGERNWT